MFVSVHIPKTGGSTFQRILVELFAPHIFLDYRKQHTVDDVYAATKTMHIRRYLRGIWYYRQARPKITDQCIHGHFKASKYRHTFTDARLIIWFRNPVERVVSHYYHWQRNSDMTHPVCNYMIRKNLTLTQFAEIDTMRNMQARYVDNVPLCDFWFIGLHEHFDDLLQKFFQLLHVQPVHVFSERVNPDKPIDQQYDIDKITRNKIELLNKRDRFLYEDALAWVVEKGWM